MRAEKLKGGVSGQNFGYFEKSPLGLEGFGSYFSFWTSPSVRSKLGFQVVAKILLPRSLSQTFLTVAAVSEGNAERLLYRAGFTWISLAATKLLKECLVILKRRAECTSTKVEKMQLDQNKTQGLKFFFCRRNVVFFCN